jgi:hypothetical protein
MAIVKVGTITATGSAFNLNLGFVPSYFKLWNDTIIASGTGVGYSEWLSSMPNASAYITTYTAGAAVVTKITSNGFTPYFPPLGTEFVPLTGLPAGATNTNLTITGISKAANASITATHAFTAADIGVTTVTIHGVLGMNQINTLSGVIQSVTSTTSFTVNINSTNFSTYTSGGIANVITGVPPSTTTGFQIYNTPLYNTGFIGITVGSTVAGSSTNVLRYVAFLDASFTSD